MAKIRITKGSYLRDMARCAETYLNIRACPGGRPIVEGVQCVHCGMDITYGDCNGVVGFAKPTTHVVETEGRG